MSSTEQKIKSLRLLGNEGVRNPAQGEKVDLASTNNAVCWLCSCDLRGEGKGEGHWEGAREGERQE
jgi:prenyltransferase beta subunit